MKRTLLVPLALLLVSLLSTTVAAQTPLTTTRVTDGLAFPVWVGAAPDDPRLFVLEKAGRVRVVKEGALLGAAFLDIQPKLSNGAEQGLLGMAFHPDYAANGFFYLLYSRTDGDSVLARYQVSAADPDLADPASEQVLLTVPEPFSNHNGGHLAFGPDGYLYAGFGDGGLGNDPFCNAQDLASLHGKILRLDVDGGSPYAIPPSNPFVGVAGAREEVWLYGLRNPWRYSFDRETGDLYIGDVGQDAREEISIAPAGASGLNFGWPLLEGKQCNNRGAANCPAGGPACTSPIFTPPIKQLFHSVQNSPGSIIGGAVYRGCAIPDLRGTYFFADYIDGGIRSFVYDPLTGTASATTDRTGELAPGGGLAINRPTSFGEDAYGELYLVDRIGGELFKVVPAAPPAGLVDCDGDGRDDGCEIAADPLLDLDQDGQLDACQGLSADTDAVSVVAMGEQRLSLHAGASHAGELYWLAGTLSGTAPGFALGGFNVPLNPDAYLDLTLRKPNQPPLVTTLGVLDASGDGQAAFSLAGLPPQPALIGQTMHHAYATVAGSPTFVSNWIPLRFEP